ncbi:MAG: hypothetical protein AAGI68_03370 [Planctomycetota bacterium]
MTRPTATLTAALIFLLFTPPLSADAVVDAQSNIRIDNVIVRGIENGNLIYVSPGGQQSLPLDRVAALELEQHPGYATAKKALADNNPALALRAANPELQKAREPWARHLLLAVIVQAFDANNQPRQAVNRYAQLLSMNPDPWFYRQAPTTSVANAPANRHPQLLARLRAIKQRAPRAAHAAIDPMIASVSPRAQAPTDTPADNKPSTPTPDAPSTPADNPASPAAPSVPNSAVVLPNGLPEDLKAVQALRAGDVETALDVTQRMVNSPRDLARNLYLLGRAQLAKADATGNPDDYKTAGLTLMRVVAHYNRLRNGIVGASLTEVGYIHLKLDKPEIAQTLFKAATPLLPEDEEPAYFNRLAELRSQLP